MKTKLTFKKLHRWPGLIISFILLYYGITGIFMNHRETFSCLDVSYKFLPDNYKYRNWNNASLKGSLILSHDSVLLYGNMGIWLTDSAFSRYHPFNDGLPEGSDNRKVADVHLTASGDLYAATFFGLWAYDWQQESWQNFSLDDDTRRFTAIESRGDKVYALSRSYLYYGASDGISTRFTRHQLAAPDDFNDRVTLFETIWQIHSGEIFGLPGKLFVDMLGLITVFLSITGIIYFFFPGWIKKRARKDKPAHRIIRVNKWSLKWHNKIGAWTFFLLIILFFTGMFLRPPLLIAIANAKVAPLKYSNLDQPNPWYDKLRDLLWDDRKGLFLISASEGIYSMDPADMKPVRFESQPPVSVMGINVFEKHRNGEYLIGSFTGLFLWDPGTGSITDAITGKPYKGDPGGRPVGDMKVTGMMTMPGGDKNLAEYNMGLMPMWHDETTPAMPEKIISESRMSLWNLCLEFHTGRIFENLTGGFYILIVPLTGITGIIVVISGYMVWRRKYKKPVDQ